MGNSRTPRKTTIIEILDKPPLVGEKEQGEFLWQIMDKYSSSSEFHQVIDGATLSDDIPDLKERVDPNKLYVVEW